MSEFFTGYRADLENKAALEAGSTPFACSSGSIPEEIDARPWIHCENQRNMNSCYGHAASTVCEHINYVATGGSKEQLSRMYAYLTGKLEAGIRGDNGCYIEAGVRALQKVGICKESTYPYPSRYTDAISDEAYNEAKSHRIQSKSLHRSQGEMLEFQGRGNGGTIAGIPWYESFANHRGPVLEYAGGPLLGFHAVGFIGYDREKRLRLFNSHDLTWGDGGSAVLSRDLIDWLFTQEGSVFCGISDLEQFGDREIPTWRGVLSA